jgi:hypothetical protein
MKTHSIQKLTEDSGFSERSSQNGIDVPITSKQAQRDASQLKELPMEFNGRGEVRVFMFIRIYKSDRRYLYKVAQPRLPVHFEVFKRVDNKRFGCVSYPNSNSFGVWAWTAKDLDSALQRFNNL